MEEAIEKLGNAILEHPHWIQVVQKFRIHRLSEYYLELTRLTHHLAYTQDLNNKSMINSLWNRILDITKHVYGDFDRSGYSNLIAEIVPNYLHDFSYSNSKEFRKLEESWLHSVGIPKKAWDKYWKLIDENKTSVLEKMKTKKFRALDEVYYYPHYNTVGPGELKPMSPFNWGRAIIVGIATTGSIVNGIAFIPTAGISATSFVGSIVASSMIAGQRS